MRGNRGHTGGVDWNNHSYEYVGAPKSVFMEEITMIEDQALNHSDKSCQFSTLNKHLINHDQVIEVTQIY